MCIRFGALRAVLVLLSVPACSRVDAPRTCANDSDCGPGAFCRTGFCLVDTQGPKVLIDGPDDGAIVTASSFRLAGSVIDGAGPGTARVECLVGDADPVTIDLVDGSFSADLHTPVVDSVAITIEVRAFDRVGAVGVARISIVADRVGPTLSITPPATNRVSASLAGTKLLWSGTATDGSGVVTRTEFSLDEEVTWSAFENPRLFTYSYSVPRDVPNSTFSLRIRAVDRAGNVSAVWISDAIFLDTRPPSVDLLVPDEETVFAGPNADTLRLAGRADDLNFTSLSYRLDFRDPTTAIAVEGGEFDVAIPLPDEDYSQHKIEVIAHDAFGNTTTVQRTFFVDRKCPILSLDGLVDGAVFLEGSPEVVVIQLSVSDAALASTTAHLDDTPLPLVDAQGVFMLTIPLRAEDRHEYTLEISATDAYGNASVLTRHFLADRLRPRLTVSSPDDGAAFNLAAPSTLEIAGTLDEGDLDSFLLVRDDSAPVPVPLEGNHFRLALALDDEDAASHVLTLAARDRLGNEARLSRHVSVDRVAPALSVVAPADDTVFNLSAPDSVTFTGTVADGALETFTWEHDDGTPSPVSVNDGAFAVSWDLGTRDWTRTTVVFVARDHLGNETRLSYDYSVDRRAPELSCDLLGGAVLSRSAPATLNVAGILHDAALETATAQFDSAPPVPITPQGGRFEIPYALADEDWTDHTLTLRARDTAGNTTTVTRSFSVDRVAPQVQVTSPHDLRFGRLAPATVSLQGSANDARLTRVQLFADDEGPVDLATTNGPFSRLLAVSTTEDFTLHTLAVAAFDAAGNEARATAHFTVDRVPPQLHFALADGTRVTASSASPYMVCGSVSDPALNEVTVAHDGGAATPLSLSDGQFCFEIGHALEDGVSHRCEIRARDSLGNESTVLRNYTVDRVPPSLRITAPASDGSCSDVCTGGIVSLASGPSYTLSGTVSDGAGLAANGVSVYIDATPLSVALNGNSWSASWTPPNEDGRMHTARVLANDRSGNLNLVERNLWVDRVAPTASTGVHGQRLVDRTAVLLSFSEPMDRSSVVSATRFNGSVPSSSFGSDDRVQFRFSLASGLVAYSVVDMRLGTGARDRAGNPVAAPVSATFLTAPVLPPSPALVSATGQSPAVAADPDGLPLVVLWTSSGFRSYRWDGRGSFVSGTLPISPSPSSGSVDELRIVQTGTNGLLPLLSARALLNAQSGSGTRLYVAESTDLTSWRGHVASTPELVAPMASWSHASFVQPFTFGCKATSNGQCTQYGDIPQEGVWYASSANRIVQQIFDAQGLGSPSTLFTPTETMSLLRGTALASATQVVYALSGTPIGAFNNASITVAGRPRFMDYDDSSAQEWGSAYATWAEVVGFPARPELRLACAAQADLASSWKLLSSAGPPVLTGSYVPVALELTRTEVAIGVLSGGSSWVGTAANGACITGPAAPTWTSLGQSASYLALAPSPAGGWYKVYVASTTGNVWITP